MEDSYCVDVAPLAEVLGESLVVSDDLTFDTFEVGTEVFKPSGPAHIDITVTNTGTAIIAMGRVSLPALATCARCLLEFPMEISAEVDGFYIRRGQEAGLPEEQEIEYIDSENRIDLFPAILAGLVLEAPFAPVHDEECAGICPTCGADLNEGPCGCDAPLVDEAHPFAALKEMLGSDSGAE
jgi:uncharacterized protein